MKRRYKIAENGESEYHIIAHQYADETIRYAASELQKYLLKSTNTVVPYFSDRCPQVGAEICIGDLVRGDTWKSPALEGLSEEAFSICGRGENLYINGNSSRGVLYGVYYFLEIFCGFACYTKDVETIDVLPGLEIELDEIVKEPAFEFRDTYFRFAFDGDFCAKNRSNTSLGDVSVAKGGRMTWFNFHHSFNDLVPTEKYFDTHPEYFSEVNGERIREKNQLCLTNPEVVKLAEQTLRRWIKENPECRVFSVAQNDGGNRCACARCLALEEEENSPSGPIIHFVNQLADSIKQDYPNILLHTFAYAYSLPAPKHVVARENVIVRICSFTGRFDTPFLELARQGSPKDVEFVTALHDWQSHASRRYIWDYAVNFHNYLQPFVHLRTLQKNVKWFKELGIKGILEQGNFAYGGGAACDELKAYVISRVLWDPDTDVEDAITRFCDAVYGPMAGKKFAEYVALVMDACESDVLTIRQYPDAPYITDELICKAEALFAEALALAENNVYRRRLEREYLSVRYLRMSRIAVDDPTRKEIVERFFEDVKSFGITEIQERRPLSASKKALLENIDLRGKPGHFLYYIMK